MKTMSKELYKDIWMHLNMEAEKAEKDTKTFADDMAEWADRPNDPLFKDAVKAYKHYKNVMETVNELLARLEELEEEGDD